jgi:acetyl-CoA carboxylase biotin carboxyl carrier protein
MTDELMSRAAPETSSNGVAADRPATGRPDGSATAGPDVPATAGPDGAADTARSGEPPDPGAAGLSGRLPETEVVDQPPVDGADASLLGLIDRLASVLERSDLTELEVTAGETTLILPSSTAVERPAALAVAAAEASSVTGEGSPARGASDPGDPEAARTAAALPAVHAPLTGIYYSAPSPGATPYVAVGDHVSAGQIIGLIEAMKLFNEIKSDLAGRVVRICADNGALVKAKQPLIEVEPL